MAALLKRGLQEDGYVVDIATTGTDAVWQAGEFDFSDRPGHRAGPWRARRRGQPSSRRRGRDDRVSP